MAPALQGRLAGNRRHLHEPVAPVARALQYGHHLHLGKPVQVPHRKLQRSVDQAADDESVAFRVQLGDRTVVAGEEEVFGRKEALPRPDQGGLGVEGAFFVDDHRGVFVGSFHFSPPAAPAASPT
jgi:hypothetical protein